jgi:hypothetical protein
MSLSHCGQRKLYSSVSVTILDEVNLELTRARKYFWWIQARCFIPNLSTGDQFRYAQALLQTQNALVSERFTRCL